VRWLVADITAAPEPDESDVWHDRAVFHFLADPADRAGYVAALERAVPWGGHAIIATFAPDGPERCSGLEVRRYDAKSLSAKIGGGFDLLRGVSEIHLTPSGTPQAFQYSVFRRH
jgi:hypothetical protein